MIIISADCFITVCGYFFDSRKKLYYNFYNVHNVHSGNGGVCVTVGEFQEFIITLGYRYNEKTKFAFNSFEGFHSIIHFNDEENRYFFNMSAGISAEGNIKEIDEMLKNFWTENKSFVTYAAYHKKQIKIHIKITIDSDVDKEHLKTTAKFVTSLYKSGKLVSICRICSREKKTGIYIVGRECMAICDSCVSRKKRLYEKRKNMFIKKKQNMTAGLFGAFFGSVLGLLIYVILYQIFPMYGIGSAVIAVLSFGGFVLCGKRATKKSGIICTIMSVIMFAAAEYSALVAAMEIEIEKLSGGIALTESIHATNASFIEMSYTSDILIETGIGTGVIIVVGILYFLKRKYTRPLKISKNLL